MQSYLYRVIGSYDIRKLPCAIRFLIKLIMKIFILIISVLWSIAAYAQPAKDDSSRLTDLRKHIEFLANDKLEGRRSGTKGEKLAYKYIVKQFIRAGIEPITDYKNYLQPFPIRDGKKITKAIVYLNKVLLADSMYFPLPWSGNGKKKLRPGETWILDISPILTENLHNPHFDLLPFVYDSVKVLSQKNVNAVIIINTEWDLSNRKGGNVLAVETNKAFAAISADSDWAFYSH